MPVERAWNSKRNCSQRNAFRPAAADPARSHAAAALASRFRAR
jgi:hypothetical protein